MIESVFTNMFFFGNYFVKAVFETSGFFMCWFVIKFSGEIFFLTLSIENRPQSFFSSWFSQELFFHRKNDIFNPLVCFHDITVFSTQDNDW